MPVGTKKDKVLRRDALPVPENLPDGTRCVSVVIPDDDEYELQFYSILRILCKWNSYQQDGGHKAADVAYIWQEALKLNECSTPSPSAGAVEVDEVGRLRVNPDNNCQLQIECSPDEWELFWDISDCIASGASQPSGGGTLSAGQCVEYDVVLNANNQYRIPVPVEAGYSIQITGASGGWSYDAGANWRCPNGQIYALGTCSGSPANAGAGFPLPAQPVGRLALKIGATWYDAYNQTIVVPYGVSSSDAYFQINDTNIADDTGSVSFHIKVCNAGIQYEQFTMDTTTNTHTTPFNTVSGVAYLVRIQGDVCHNPANANHRHDAIHSTNDNWATNLGRVLFGAGPLYYGVLIDGQNLPDQAHNAGHDYSFIVTGTGAAFVFKPVANSPYASCGGTFTVTVQTM